MRLVERPTRKCVSDIKVLLVGRMCMC